MSTQTNFQSARTIALSLTIGSGGTLVLGLQRVHGLSGNALSVTVRTSVGESKAGEVVAAVQTAMLAGLPYTNLRDAVIAHLNVADGLGPLLSKAPPKVAL